MTTGAAGEESTPAADAAASGGEVDQPGLRELREAVAFARRRLPGRSSLRQDVVAGLNTSIANVPDGMANAVIVGVNPIFGLYATTLGPLVGGVLSSTQLMVITTTAAASLTAGQSLTRVPPDDRANALFVMVVLTGLFQFAFGLFGFGNLARFVSYSVSAGLLAGISILLVLSQVPTVAGYDAEGANRVTRAFDVVLHPRDLNYPSLALALLTVALAVLLPRTSIGKLGRLVAIIIPSILVVVLSLGSVALVKDVGDIPAGFPRPSLPHFDLWLDVVTGALSLSVVILVQGAGVGQSVPNSDGSHTQVSRDFMAQGAANVASGFFHGLPVGGSMSATALNVISGAATRWAGVFAGLWMAAIVIAFPAAVSRIAMPALGALLILAGMSSLKPANAATVANAGWPAILAALTTFLATLFLPIQVAVGIGVVLAALLYLTESANDISVVELVEHENGSVEERKAPTRLQPRTVTVLDVYGHLFYAGARTLERQLPSPNVDHAALIVRLRGRTNVGATLIDVLANYARELDKRGGRLYLTGMSSRAHRQIERSGRLHLNGPVRAYAATPILGEATREALVDARAWLASLPPEDQQE